jgi:hypothetical protein
MLIGDINTLETVYTLNLSEQVILYGSDTLDVHKVVRIYGTFGKLFACLKLLSVGNLDP